MNINFARQALEWLKNLGVEEVLLCAGARNAPLVYALEDFDFKVRCFFEERSAGFFALGKIAASNRPVAVLTTSGTAVAELLPSVIEAFYQCRPLILVTADRPKSFRGSGAPQTIDQVGLFSNYVEACLDLQVGETPELQSYSYERPLHLNLCFAEPLLKDNDERGLSWKLPVRRPLTAEFSEVTDQSFTELSFPLVIVGELSSDSRGDVEKLLSEKKWDCYLESPSGLSSEKFNSHQNERWIREKLKQGIWKSVIRIGNVPTTRIWRDLEDLNLPVYSFSNRPFRGLSCVQAQVFSLEALSQLSAYSPSQSEIEDTGYRKKLEDLFEAYPQSEPAWMFKLFNKIPEQSLLYLGNSLPIREWDLVWDRVKSFEIYSHRGANGIDGQISGFLGRAVSSKSNFAILGDLTTLYDLSGLWGYSANETGPLQIIVINNQGGKIFSRMFDKPEFLNQHQMNFSGLAQLWNWKYQAPPTIEEWRLNDSPCIVEIHPNEEQTTAFWKKLEALSGS